MVYRKVSFWGAVKKLGLIGGVVKCVLLFCFVGLIWFGVFFTVR